jgi:hypothetical protein
MNQLSLLARQQALAEQQQYANLGQGMLGSAYVPQAALLNAFQTSIQPAQIQAGLQQQRALTGAELGMGGLAAQQAAGLGQANLTGNLLSSLAALAQGQSSQQGGGGVTLEGLWDLITKG